MNDERISILDGWRALSILAVLAGHLLPLGPASWRLNEAVAASGMAIFFTLSGFLITRLLLADQRVAPFLIRRMFRIVPLAWVAMLILAVASHANSPTLLANLAFYANLPPTWLMTGGAHLWSLCVEVQFYVFVAMIVGIGGRRALLMLPAIMVAITLTRIAQNAPISIYTWQRVDEILAGSTIALLFHYGILQRLTNNLPNITILFLFPLILVSGHHAGGAMMYTRPYITAATVGISIFSAPKLLRDLFVSRPAVYIATISYALYVIHGMLVETWLGSGEKLIKYAKRPLLFAATFALAHLSTFQFETRMIAIGKALARRFGGPRSVSSPVKSTQV